MCNQRPHFPLTLGGGICAEVTRTDGDSRLVEGPVINQISINEGLTSLPTVLKDVILLVALVALEINSLRGTKTESSFERRIEGGCLCSGQIEPEILCGWRGRRGLRRRRGASL